MNPTPPEPPFVPAPPSTSAESSEPQLARRLGLFDATMIVMGGIVGSGIFVTPYVVARQVHTPALIVGAWLAGGLIALAGAFVYAELAARRPHVGGQYAYLRDAYHPAVAFVYGWALLLVIQTGGMAAVAVTFARYFREVTHVPLAEPVVAALGIALLVAVNCMGVRSGSTVQNALMVLKIVAILALVAAGLLFLGADGRRRRRAPAGAVRKPAAGVRRGHDARDVLVRRMADGQLRRRRDAQPAARPRPRAADRRGGRDRAVRGGHARLHPRPRARTGSPRRRRRPPA